MPRPDDSGGHPRTGQNACFMLASRSLTLSPSAGYVSRSCTSTSGSAISPTAYRILCVRLPCKFVRGLRHSAAGPTLDTGGWLALTRPGLSPGKRRRALLGANSVSRSVIPFLDICGRRVERHGKGDRDAPITLPAGPPIAVCYRSGPDASMSASCRIPPKPSRAATPDRRWLAGARPVSPLTGWS
jgi:hypothetical protein